MTPEQTELVNAVTLAERFGWSLEYVDEMEPAERAEVIAVLDALDKARAHRQRRGMAKGSGSRRR